MQSLSTNAMARWVKKRVLYVLESTFHQRQRDKVSSEVCWQIQRIPLKKAVGCQDESARKSPAVR
jgi:hypothetical protein